MADHCGICDTRRPEGGTKILVLNGGALWIEFCKHCENSPITNAETGETITVGALFDQSSESNTPKGDGTHVDDTPLLDAFRDTDDDWDEDAFNRSWAEWEELKAHEQRMERLDAPTWYEALGEFILGRKQRTLRNLRA